jgi:hypothetical protein
MKAGRFFVAVILWAVIYSISFGYSGGDGTSGNPYQIADVNDLLELSTTPTDYIKYFILTEDIDLKGQVFPTAIIASDTDNSAWGFQGYSFSGNFDGNGHKIKKFSIDGGNNDFLGLFGQVDINGEVKNLGLINCNVSGYSIAGSTGSLVGMNMGRINRCFSTALVYGSFDVGNLVGCNYRGSINYSYSTGSVSSNNSSSHVGGLVGRSYFGNINRCYSAVLVNGFSSVGGLVGHRFAGDISDCFWDIETSGQVIGRGAIGKTTIEMMALLTFTSAGWDFMNETANGTEDIWFIREGLEYPRFVWEDQEPIANAGEDVSVHCELNGFAAVQLDGSGSSDADNDPLTYHWNWAIDQQAFTAEGVAPMIQLPIGIHEITLIVNDGIVGSEPNTVTVTVYNAAPEADAGVDITAYLGFGGDTVDVTLDGSGSSDSDGDALIYKWYQGESLLAEGVNPTVSLPAGVHTITLIVNDGIEDSQADEMAVTVDGPVAARVKAVPCVLNLKSHDKYLWIMMDLPRGISMAQMDRKYGYFVLPGQIRPSWVGYVGGWCPKVMVRVEKDILRPYLHTGRMELTFYGRLKDGRYIGGCDKIQVINPPDKKNGK